VTRDGGTTWKDVTPPGLTAWSKVSIMDAGRFDADTAYAAVNRIRLSDQKPHIYRTHDSGKTWTEIVQGLPDNAPINAVREDPVRKGLLFAGSERAVHVSFNDGDDWQPLRLNMPATSIRDLVIHNDDVVVGTHGRSFWILDDITPLRQLKLEIVQEAAVLFKPQTATRVRWNMNTDTPLPPDEPAAKNPPDGAILNYYLKEKANGPVTLEVFDVHQKLVRRYSSTDKPEPVNAKEVAIPTYWIRPPQILSAEAGSHRFIWDLHYPPPPGQHGDYPIAAIYMDTPREPHGPWVQPGNYTVKLTVGDKSYTQPLTVKMDPRVKTTPQAIQRQFTLSMQCYEGLQQVHKALEDIRGLRKSLKDKQSQAKDGGAANLAALDKKLAALEGEIPDADMRFYLGNVEPSFTKVNGELAKLLGDIQGADVPPTSQVVTACEEVKKTLARLMNDWQQLHKRSGE
jgi:hypothetical protein